MSLHHVELWVPDLAAARGPWGWLLGELGWQPYQDWPRGRSWRHGEMYLVLEQSPALSRTAHDRGGALRRTALRKLSARRGGG